MNPGLRTTAAVVVALSVALGFVEAMQIYLGAVAVGEPAGWWQAVVMVMPSWIILAALIPGVLYLAHRLPMDRRRWQSSVTVHVFAAAIFAVLHLFGTAAVYLTSRGLSAILVSFSELMARYFVLDVLTYGAVVFVCYTIHYYRAYKAREVVSAQLEASLAEARLHALRSQLDPHFLFNTLNVVSALAARGKRDEVVEVVSRLSELLRLTLDERAVQEVPLRQELEFVRLYLDIQQIRFGDRLHVETTVPPETLDAMVPAMLLQPLVENAVVHGISKTPGPGRVTIRSSRVDGRLRLEIGDTGPGFEDPPPVTPARGIGLANTRARLAQLYGADHSLACGASASGGACVTVGIPFRVQPEVHEAVAG